MSILSCLRCGCEIQRKAGVPGPAPKYCGYDCKRLTAYERRIASGAYAADQAKRRAAFQPKPLAARPCKFCNATFEAKRVDAAFCSQLCTTKWNDAHGTTRCSEEDCSRGVRAKGLCNMHWRRKARADGREVSAAWDERRKSNYQKRRALKMQLPADDIRPADVYERDGWMCNICSGPVDRDL